MSRKLLSDPYLAIHGKIMAKNGHFFMEFWPIFDIFHGLRPYLCSKAQDLGFHKQPTHRRRGDEPFFYSGVDRSWLGMAQKWSILDQNWPNRAGLSTFQTEGQSQCDPGLAIQQPSLDNWDSQIDVFLSEYNIFDIWFMQHSVCYFALKNFSSFRLPQVC